MAMTDLTIVRRSLLGRSFSSVTTILIVAIAVALMLVLVGLSRSAQAAFTRGTGNAEMLVTREPSPLVSVLNSVFYADAPAVAIPYSDYEELRSRFPLAWTVATAMGDSFAGRPVVAAESSFFEFFQPVPGVAWSISEGRFFERELEVVVGAEAARTSGLTIGESLFLTHGAPRDPDAHVHDEYTFTVVGILEPTDSPHDRALFVDLMSSWILHAHDRRLAELGPGAPLTRPEDIVEGDKLITGIYASMGARKAALPQILAAIRADPRWTVAQPAQEVSALFAIVSNVDLVLRAMAGAVLLSSTASILIALTGSMEQRRRQIATLRVLGASRGRIFGLVLTESALLGVLGAALGAGLAWAGIAAAAGLVEASVGVGLSATLGLEPVLIVGVAAIALACLAGIVPAVMAYRTSVIRNLRPLG
ncbi:MAG: ABC transporter permease [Planctomycetota bacterium]